MADLWSQNIITDALRGISGNNYRGDGINLFKDSADRVLANVTGQSAPTFELQAQIDRYNSFTPTKPTANTPTAQNDSYNNNSNNSNNTSYNPADIAYLDDQIARLQRQHGSADTALNNGLTQLQDSYNREVQGANTRQNQTMQDFTTKETDTTRAKDSALTRTNENARTLAEGLRRRLGLASGSGSSAFQFAAPGAVAKMATENRTGVLENFGANFRDLNTSRDRVKSQYEEMLADLEAQRKTRESDFRSGILEKKNQIDTLYLKLLVKKHSLSAAVTRRRKQRWLHTSVLLIHDKPK